MNQDPQVKQNDQVLDNFTSSQEEQQSIIETLKFEELSPEEHNYDTFGWYPE